MEHTDPSACQRCGACCRKGGPALHAQDLPLFGESGSLGLADVVTLRAGELAHDQVQGRIAPLEGEMLKLRGREGSWTCRFYHHATRACTLYQDRPAECRLLNCRDTAALAAMYASERLTRADLLPPGHPVLLLLGEHEGLVPAACIPELGLALRAGDGTSHSAAQELVRMALADEAFRRNLRDRAGIGPEYHDFFFGRGAGALFAAAGVTLRADARNGLRVQSDPLWRSAQ